jgi:hypothetical protein
MVRKLYNRGHKNPGMNVGDFLCLNVSRLCIYAVRANVEDVVCYAFEVGDDIQVRKPYSGIFFIHDCIW